MASSLKLWVLAICSCFLLQVASGIPLAEFYPFGNATGDNELGSNDDSSTPAIGLSTAFPFFGATHSSLFVNNNGDISFTSAVRTFTSSPFPLPAGNNQLIAPYWADIDTRGRGRVWYRSSSNNTLLMRARNEIRMAFISQMNFQPSFLFIATWDGVGFFGGSSSTLINTFQCVLVTDGQRSFVLFFYADGLIQWTTGNASEGSGGLGGTQAQVGFNAGDGIRFASVPGSRTPDIINIDTTSNVGRNGVWIFRVDQEDIVTTNCDNDGPLVIAPRLGNMLGGTPILIAGPCFDPTDTIICMFDGRSEVTGTYVSDILAICASPYFETTGWKDFTVTIWSSDDMVLRYSRDTRFYAVSFQESADVRISIDGNPSSLHITRDTPLRVSWDHDALLPMLDPASFSVDIALSRMNLRSGRWERLQSLATGRPNDGEAMVTVPAILGDNAAVDLDELYPVAIEIIPSSPPSQAEDFVDEILPPLGIFDRVIGSVKRWSSVAFYSLTSELHEHCERWCSEQPEGIGSAILSRLPPCPPRLEQAVAQNSRFTRDTGLARFLSRNFFHRGTETCFRQTNPSSRSGQQCCYDSDDTLVTNSPGGGTVDRVSPEVSYTEHFMADVLPSITCCLIPFSNCDVYYEKRPSDNGSRYDPPAPACIYGDPHIVSLDGFKYTFNGLGEYTLIQTPENQFTLQGRMEIPIGVGIEGGVQATVFTAIVAREEFSDTIQIQLTSDGQSLEMLMNEDLVDFSVRSEQEFGNVTVYDAGNDSLSVRFSSGAYLEAREENGFISILIVSLPRSFSGQTAGLMGNYNGQMADDLTPRGSAASIPLDSSLENIHNMFGVTWIINSAEDSLFTYGEETSHASFHSPGFTPTFSPSFPSAELEANARVMCMGDPFCLFDVAATGSTEIGLSTLIGNLEFENIVNISRPVSCIPPCENGVCVQNGLCSCSMGYEGDRCTDPVFTECDTNPCLNGGSCTVRAGSYICTCSDRSSGLQCQISDIDGPIIINSFSTSTTIALSWVQPPGSSVDRYRVSYTYTIRGCGSSSASGRAEISNGTARTFTLTNLEEDSDYTITLTAISAEGSQSNSADFAATTATAAPSGVPESVSFSLVNLTSVTVHWGELPCSDRNGEITGYVVEYSSALHSSTNFVPESGGRTLVVGGLLPRTSYIFSVRADGADNPTSRDITTLVPPALSLFHNGRILPNNSRVLLSDIGEGSSALYCLTDRTQCCSASAGGVSGGWNFPDGSGVTDAPSNNFYVSRGSSSVSLNRRSGVGQIPIGRYTCLIPDASNVLRTLAVEVSTDGDLDGSGSGGLVECTCLRGVECSIAGTYNQQRTEVIPNGASLRCVIDISDAGMEQDFLQVGSGFGGFGFGISSFAIDDTFNIGFLSPGSFVFLRAIGAIPRDVDVSSCSLSGSSQTQQMLLEFLGVDEITLIQRDDGFNSVSLNMTTILQIVQSGDITIGGRLNSVHACSFQALLEALAWQPGFTSYSCRTAMNFDLSTVISFRVSCG